MRRQQRKLFGPRTGADADNRRVRFSRDLPSETLRGRSGAAAAEHATYSIHSGIGSVREPYCAPAEGKVVERIWSLVLLRGRRLIALHIRGLSPAFPRCKYKKSPSTSPSCQSLTSPPQWRSSAAFPSPLEPPLRHSSSSNLCAKGRLY